MFSMIPEQFFFNYIDARYDEKGYAYFRRFYPEQMKVYSKNKMYREMSESAAGVVLNFITTGNKVQFKCKTTSKLETFAPIMQQITMKSILYAMKHLPKDKIKNDKVLLDGIDFVVDGKLISTKHARRGTMKFRFENPEKKRCEVKIYFPVIFELNIKDLKINGTVEHTAAKEIVLALGDSITQGFIAGRPSLNYVARISDKLNINIINQGVGGYVYESESLNGLEKFSEQFGQPKFITVAYGTNDWHYKIQKSLLQKKIAAYYARLTSIFPTVPIYAISPIWRGDWDLKGEGAFPFSQLCDLIQNETAAYKTIKFIDGMKLVPHDFKYFSDIYLHPNASCFRIMADNILEAIK